MSLLFLFAGVGTPAAPGDNEGACTQTLGALTGAGTGTLAITGTCDQTLGELTCLATDLITVVVEGGGVRPRPVEVRGAWVVSRARLNGALDVRVAVRGAWVGRMPRPVGALACRVTLAGAWTPRASETRARAVVANPGQHIVVVEDDAECLVIVP